MNSCVRLTLYLIAREMVITNLISYTTRGVTHQMKMMNVELNQKRNLQRRYPHTYDITHNYFHVHIKLYHPSPSLPLPLLVWNWANLSPPPTQKEPGGQEQHAINTLHSQEIQTIQRRSR